MTPQNTVSPSSILQSLINTASQELAQRLEIQAEKIVLIEAKEVVWSDGSLGCPVKGMVYMQVLTPGYLIRLSANDMEYEYHTDKSSLVIFCPVPQLTFPGKQTEP